MHYYPAANWAEREIFDSYGIFFVNHTDLRRILTDYGFALKPLLKHSALVGMRNINYNLVVKGLIYKPYATSQCFRIFSKINPWSDMQIEVAGFSWVVLINILYLLKQFLKCFSKTTIIYFSLLIKNFSGFLIWYKEIYYVNFYPLAIKYNGIFTFICYVILVIGFNISQIIWNENPTTVIQNNINIGYLKNSYQVLLEDLNKASVYEAVNNYSKFRCHPHITNNIHIQDLCAVAHKNYKAFLNLIENQELKKLIEKDLIKYDILWSMYYQHATTKTYFINSLFSYDHINVSYLLTPKIYNPLENLCYGQIYKLKPGFYTPMSFEKMSNISITTEPLLIKNDISLTALYAQRKREHDNFNKFLTVFVIAMKVTGNHGALPEKTGIMITFEEGSYPKMRVTGLLSVIPLMLTDPENPASVVNMWDRYNLKHNPEMLHDLKNVVKNPLKFQSYLHYMQIEKYLKYIEEQKNLKDNMPVYNLEQERDQHMQNLYEKYLK